MSQTSGVFGVLLICILYAIPLALIYNLFFYKKFGFISNFILLVAAYLLGFVATLLYYRVVIMNDAEAKINKMDRNTVSYIGKTAFFSFKIVALTILALAINPSLVSIFENTIGYWFIGLFGLTELSQQIFSSKTMDPIKENSDVLEFNYNFLITRMDINNVSKFINHAKKCKEEEQEEDVNLPFDFTLNITTEEQMQQLENLVFTKYTFGHYIWVYLASIVSIIVSITSVTM